MKVVVVVPVTNEKAKREAEGKKGEKCAVTDADVALCNAACAWAEALTDEQVNAEKGDYLHNLRAVCRSGLVSFKRAGVVASVLVAYERAMGRERQKAERAARPTLNEHVGTVGKRETWTLTLDFVTGYGTDYGYTTVYKFRTAEGATLVWKASSAPDVAHVGDAAARAVTREDVGRVYTVTGTVKAHGDYKGAKQTMLSRCSLLDAAAPPPEPKPKKKAPTKAERQVAHAARAEEHAAHVALVQAKPPYAYGQTNDCVLVVHTGTHRSDSLWLAPHSCLDYAKGSGFEAVTIIAPYGGESWTWVKP